MAGSWSEVLAAFTDRLGPPTRVGGTSRIGDSNGGPLHEWAVIEGDTCAVLTLQTDAQGATRANHGSFERGKLLFDDCAAAAPARR